MAAKPAQFAAAVLRGIGAPVTSQNIAGFIGWSKAEGPIGSSSWQRNNPLNTTESQGAVGGAFNSAGVRGYPTPQAGVRATVKTLTNGDYGGIVRAFKQNNPHALGPAIGASPWGTSGSLAAQTIADTLSQHFNAPSGASSLGAPSQPSRRDGATTVRLPGRTVTTQKQVFDSGAFNAAKAANLVGNYLSSVKNPAAGLAPKIPGLTSAASSNPLFTAGVVTTGEGPNPSDYMKAQTVLERVAGESLTVHPTAALAAGRQHGQAIVNNVISGADAGHPGLAKAVNVAIRAANFEKRTGAYRYTQDSGGPGDSRTNAGAGVLHKARGASQITFDCSGFVDAVYKAAGLGSPFGDTFTSSGFPADINHRTMEQVNMRNMKPGAIIGMNNHVTLYIGHGKVVNMGAQGQPYVTTVAAELAGHGESQPLFVIQPRGT